MRRSRRSTPSTSRTRRATWGWPMRHWGTCPRSCPSAAGSATSPTPPCSATWGCAYALGYRNKSSALQRDPAGSTVLRNLGVRHPCSCRQKLPVANRPALYGCRQGVAPVVRCGFCGPATPPSSDGLKACRSCHSDSVLSLAGWRQVGFGYSLLAYSSMQRGISKLQLDRAALAADLDTAWEVREFGTQLQSV